MTFANLRPFLFYAASIALGKGLSLITLPVMARALDPAQFVRLDMAASLVEPVGLFAAFAWAIRCFAMREARQKKPARRYGGFSASEWAWQRC